MPLMTRRSTSVGRRGSIRPPLLIGQPEKVPKLSDYRRAEAIKRRNAGERLADIAKNYDVDISMISRLT